MKSTFIPMAARAIAPVAVVGLGLATASIARANLNMDIRFPATGGGHIYSMASSDIGNPIEIDIWAQITPTSFDAANPNYPGGISDYGFTEANYGIYSTEVANPLGSTAGIGSGVNEAWANQLGSGAGKITDSNGDGANDLGYLYPPKGANSGLGSPHGITGPGTYGYQVSPSQDVEALPGGGFEFLVEKAYFTPTAADIATSSLRQIDFTILTATAGATAAIWTQDNDGNQNGAARLYAPGNTGTLTAQSPNFTGGAMVVLYSAPTPEPASLSLLGLTAAGLLARRRK